MKKTILLSLSILVVLSLKAQLFNIAGVDVGYLYVGPKLGGNASYNSTSTTITGASKAANFGYEIGGFAKLGITEKLFIQPELLFTSKGYKENADNLEIKNDANYFGLPIVAKYAFAAVSDVKIYGSGGFYTDYMTSLKTTVKVDGEVQDEHKWTDYSTINRIDFGFNLGAGANIPLKNKDLINIDFRYSFGVTDVSDASGSSSNKNTTFQLSLNYMFDLTRFVNFKGKSEG